jgi:hypothetical protein
LELTLIAAGADFKYSRSQRVPLKQTLDEKPFACCPAHGKQTKEKIIIEINDLA